MYIHIVVSAPTLIEQALHAAQFVAIEVRMLTIFRQLALAFQLWTITSTCVHAQLPELYLQPPYVISVGVRTGDSIPFSCATLSSFPLEEWALYRNGVRQNTTDPCTSAGKVSADGVLTISSECDGFYSCGAEYTNTENQTGPVFSNALRVYGECLSLCLPFNDFNMEKANLASDLFGFVSPNLPLL